jgi:hypothetical protein
MYNFISIGIGHQIPDPSDEPPLPRSYSYVNEDGDTVYVYVAEDGKEYVVWTPKEDESPLLKFLAEQGPKQPEVAGIEAAINAFFPL